AHRKALAAAFRELDVTLLNNQAAAIELRGERVWIVGVGDAYTSHDDLAAALCSIPRDERSRILLSHYPDVVADYPLGELDLVLAGHSHGAQINLPVLAQL